MTVWQMRALLPLFIMTHALVPSPRTRIRRVVAPNANPFDEILDALDSMVGVSPLSEADMKSGLSSEELSARAGRPLRASSSWASARGASSSVRPCSAAIHVVQTAYASLLDGICRRRRCCNATGGERHTGVAHQTALQQHHAPARRIRPGDLRLPRAAAANAYRSVPHGLVSVARAEGPLALWRGLAPGCRWASERRSTPVRGGGGREAIWRRLSAV